MLDARHGFKSNDAEFASRLDTNDVYFQVILTKCDLLKPDDLARRIAEVQNDTENYRFCNRNVLLASTKNRSLINEIRQEFFQMGIIPNKVCAELKQALRRPIFEKCMGFENKKYK